MNPRLKRALDRKASIVARRLEIDNECIERSIDLGDHDSHDEYAALEAELPKVCELIETLGASEQLIARSLVVGVAAGVSAEVAPAVEAISAPTVIHAEPTKAPKPELIYRAQESEFNPLADLHAMQRGDSAAAGRIFAHNAENAHRVRLEGERIDRATTTALLGGLVIPEYLVNDLVPYVSEGRQLANVVTRRPLTRLTTTLPAVTSAAAMGMVASEGTAYTSANYGTAGRDIVAKTVGGYVDVSVESLQFGSLDQGAVFIDLFRDYNKIIERQIFNGADASGEVEGIFNADGLNSVTATSATSGAAELHAKVVEAASKVHTAIEEEATYVVMSSIRWYKLLSEVGTDKRPLLGMTDGQYFNALGQATAMRTFGNLPVILSNAIYNGITSGDTKVVVTKASDLWLLEANNGIPTNIVAEPLVKNGLVTFAARNFIGFTAERRPGATTVITGLPVPTF